MRRHIQPGVARFLLALALCVAVAPTPARQAAQEPHRHGAGQQPGQEQPAPRFEASTAKPFAALMLDAMAVMNDGMQRAPVNGVPEHDFITMMIPHHQGAIDMAKALLLTTTDPELKNLALAIVTEQHNEIRQMQAWLRRDAERRRK